MTRRKALKGLFSKTEPEAEPVEIKTPKLKSPVSKTRAEKPHVEEPEAPQPQEAQHSLVAHEEVSSSLNAEEMEIAVEASLSMDSDVQEQSSAEESVLTEEAAIAETENNDLSEEYSLAQDEDDVTSHHVEEWREPSEQRKAEFSEAVLRVHYNFDQHKLERQLWRQDEYLDLIKRIDAAQTEAFLLKGKLLEEVKRRFFEDNKVGWKRFCEESLDLNYTTANQYIRVSQEFDVTSHRRPDFGFEHFKALLPLPPEARQEVIAGATQLSVKALRRIVQEKLAKPEEINSKSKNSDSKAIVNMLHKLKLQIFDCEFDSLPQMNKWQLSAACKNLSEELSRLAESLAVPTEMKSRQGAISTASIKKFHQQVESSTDSFEDNS